MLVQAFAPTVQTPSDPVSTQFTYPLGSTLLIVTLIAEQNGGSKTGITDTYVYGTSASTDTTV
jgi:hypothetical protein